MVGRTIDIPFPIRPGLLAHAWVPPFWTPRERLRFVEMLENLPTSEDLAAERAQRDGC